jgi:hypothetical protein
MTTTTTPPVLKLFPPAPETDPDAWLPGAPARVPPAIVRADCRIYASCRCAGCGRRGMQTEAQHNGHGRYRIMGKCRWCGAVETF